ncbi:hypothetical protein BOTBODRAFT_28855 [Botryobasidium botryosum FD-172 SS1]|uniref:Uncharacterized protein n=1 Tax=Botryobasidium botryosum (strain FD-172 SS1) TaxID=930990 RepID=A0A067MRW0_BOTB1|nr:hypothetical protein BOTBODRAFT_28855 [Botryobasidium botryosum FD-172 SS1]
MGECQFFEWQDGPAGGGGGGGGTSRAPPAKRRKSTGGRKGAAAAAAADARMCKCNTDAMSRTVSKEGPNKGKVFWVCQNWNQDGDCKFFEWDVPAVGAGGGGGGGGGGFSGGGGGGGGGGQSGACFKCGEPGHWSNACPNNR